MRMASSVKENSGVLMNFSRFLDFHKALGLRTVGRMSISTASDRDRGFWGQLLRGRKPLEITVFQVTSARLIATSTDTYAGSEGSAEAWKNLIVVNVHLEKAGGMRGVAACIR